MALIEGILPALLTPMDERGAVEPNTLRRLVDWHFAHGVHGLYLCGTSGEGLLLTEEERRAVVEHAVGAAARRGKLIVHVGAVQTAEAARLARHAEEVGADAVAAVPPFAFGRDPSGMRTHYRAIAEACTLPVYLYNIPSVTAVQVTADVVRPLLDLPRIQGLKFSDYNLFAEFELMELGPDFDVFHGCDETLLYALMMGAVGGIGLTYNFMPGLYVELYAAARAGDCAKANRLQLLASRWIEVFLRHARNNAVGLAKAYMKTLGFECGAARAPNPPVPAGAVKGLVEELSSKGYADQTAAFAKQA